MTRKEAVRFLTLHPERFGQMVGFTKLGDLHGRWIREMVTGQGDKLLQAHRGSYKTTCVSIALAVIMILFPNLRVLFLRKTDDDVKEIISQVKKILTMPQTAYLIQQIYSVNLRLTTDNSLELNTNLTTDTRGTSQLIGLGIGGSLTGKHFDRIFTDDIVNRKDRISKAERERTKLIVQELQNIRNPGGRIFNTGTPWHPEDAFTLMPEPEKWDCYRTKMLTDEQIAELRQSMSPSLFAANYELRHIAAEDALFKTPPVFATDAVACQLLKRKDAKAEDLIRDGIAHIDAAYGGEDFTAFTCGKRVGDKLIMYGRMWHGHVDTVLDAALADTKRLMCAPVWTETNADKGFLAKEIARKGYLAKKYTERENKYVKISSFLRKWWPSIIWLPGTDRDYLAQIQSYTEDAEHDDAPDSAAVICRCYDRRADSEYQSMFTGQNI